MKGRRPVNQLVARDQAAPLGDFRQRWAMSCRETISVDERHWLRCMSPALSQLDNRAEYLNMREMKCLEHELSDRD